MGDLSEYFSRKEFACNCGCGFDTVDTVTHYILVDLRKHFVEKYPERNVYITINSGCRCLGWNDHEGGSDYSLHVEGKAADTVVHNVPPAEVWGYLVVKYPGKFGLGLYRDFVHIDCRSGMPWRKI